MSNVCSKCGAYAIGTLGMLTAHLADGLCIVCREEPDYGCRAQDVGRLKMFAEAERAAHPLEPSIRCAGPGCLARAKEFWFFCSRKCRDDFVALNP